MPDSKRPAGPARPLSERLDRAAIRDAMQEDLRTTRGEEAEIDRQGANATQSAQTSADSLKQR
ncbi:hypothetical protein [Chitinasiproducens palmae]|uniref:Uncharacterized protein n=1 Tax=Chitinasiproducens palmae TaxID=1770053 RepID=A0A1H2PNL0_9BURK|nr:hypothetical protein [Chitinasiproducens palmae]SDV47765.1 hypothetical protein SAMN05216551_103279 [Chitinasiproducens palmae]